MMHSNSATFSSTAQLVNDEIARDCEYAMSAIDPAGTQTEGMCMGVNLRHFSKEQLIRILVVQNKALLRTLKG